MTRSADMPRWTWNYCGTWNTSSWQTGHPLSTVGSTKIHQSLLFFSATVTNPIIIVHGRKTGGNFGTGQGERVQPV